MNIYGLLIQTFKNSQFKTENKNSIQTKGGSAPRLLSIVNFQTPFKNFLNFCYQLSKIHDIIKAAKNHAPKNQKKFFNIC